MNGSCCRVLWIVALTWLTLVSTSAAEARILKVLGHFTDIKGREGLSPSLYERDAYQAELRRNPDRVHGMRYSVLVKASRTQLAKGPILCQLALRTANHPGGDAIVLSQSVEPGWNGRTWLKIPLEGDAYRNAGTVHAWKASLVQDGKTLSEVRSFLW